MKIGLVLAKPPGYSETFFNSKIEGLSDNGHEVILFCKKENTDFNKSEVRWLPSIRPNPIVQGIKTILVLISLLPYLGRCLKLYKLERQQNSSVLEILKKLYLNAPILKSDLDWLHFGFATLALKRELVAEAIGARLAISLRGFDISIYPLKHPNCYKLLWQKVDKVHSISNDLIKLAFQHGLSKDIEVEKITPAVNISNFNSNKTLAENKISKKNLNFLTVARLHWKKGLIDTLVALAQLKNQDVKFNYNIIGEGEQLEELIFTINQLNLTNEVHLVGRKSHSEVILFMSQSDYYIQYSHSEGFCNSVLEAQAMGLICIVSDAEGLSENILNNETGFIVSKYKPSNLTRKIQEVIALDNSEKIAIRKSAILRVRNQFNLDKQKKEFNLFYTND